MRRNENEKRIGLGVSSIERRTRGGTVDQTAQPIGRNLSGKDRNWRAAGIRRRVRSIRVCTVFLYRPGSVDRSLRVSARAASYSAFPDERLFPAGYCRASGIGFEERGAQLSKRCLCDRSAEQSQLAPVVFAKSNLNAEVMSMGSRKKFGFLSRNSGSDRK